jgi:hypothetical protein
MKLTSVEIHSENSSDPAILSFRDPTADFPFNIKEITGLDADQIIPRFYGPATTNFYEYSLEKRDIVFKIQLNPSFSKNETYSDLRDKLYRMISSTRTGKIKIQFMDDVYAVAAINGSISKFETSHFERVQEVQLTVNCDEPMLKAIDPVNVSLTGLNFTRTIIEDTKSTAPHGFSFDINVTAVKTGVIAITDPDDPSWNFTITLGWGVVANDRIIFSTDSKDRQLYVLRGTTKIYIGDYIGLGSVWPVIFPGINTFSFSNNANLTWRSISYYPTYWGV